MSPISAAGSVRQTPGTPNTASSLNHVHMDQFLQLLITQMQNQDPLDPMNNSEMLQQISQIREISATNRLTETLESVLIGQNMATASSLVGKRIRALSDTAKDVEGTVDRVTLESNENNESQRILRLHVGDQQVSLNNLRAILSD